jgi:uncharacterized protein
LQTISSALSQFDCENVISVETYRKSGKPVRTPVWFLKEDDKLVVHTSGRSGKVKRIRGNSKVRVAPSKFRGEPKGDYIDARAEIVTDPDAVKKYYSLIYKKYGLMGSMTKLMQRFSKAWSKLSRSSSGPRRFSVLLFIRPVIS